MRIGRYILWGVLLVIFHYLKDWFYIINILYYLLIIIMIINILFKLYIFIDKKAHPGQRIKHRMLKNYMVNKYGKDDGVKIYKDTVNELRRKGYK